MFTYSQLTGIFYKDNVPIANGYSGTREGRNNPNMQNVQSVGPIPRGLYAIGTAYEHPHLGPVVMNLEPDAHTETFGRSLFRIHGNNAKNDASHGCIILPRQVREEVAASANKDLTVVQ